MLAVGGAAAGWFFIQSQTPTERVVVTQGKLPVGTVINPQHVTTKLVAKAMLPQGAVTKPEDATGKTLVMPVLGGDILRQEHIVAGQGSLNARLISVAPGRVAVDLPQEAAAGLRGLDMGDKVNLYGEIGVVSDDGSSATAVEMVAKDAIILYAPNVDNKRSGVDALIVGVLPEEEKRIADVLTRGKRVTVFLQQGGE